MPRPQTESSVAKNVTNRFYYLKWDDIFHRERPFQVLIDIPPDAHDQRKQNIDFQLGDDEVVVDVRGLPVMPTLDAAAFTYIRVPTTLAPQNFSNKQMIEIQYLPECEALLKENLDGVDEMVIYDWRVGRSIHIVDKQNYHLVIKLTILCRSDIPRCQSDRAVWWISMTPCLLLEQRLMFMSVSWRASNIPRLLKFH